MKLTKISILTAVSLTLFGTQAYGSMDLAKAKNCLACHAVDKKVVGPAFNDVKAKYAKDPSAVDKLALKVQKGGFGVWGTVPMPPNTLVSEAEAKTLVKWVLGK